MVFDSLSSVVRVASPTVYINTQYVIKYKTGQNMYIVHTDVESLRLGVFIVFFFY